MLAIRLQRLGRKALPVYRLAVQEAQRHPSSGRVVAYVGSYNPHTKQLTVNAEKIAFYLKNGAQPTPRVVRILASESIELPDWVKKPRTDKQSTSRNPEKLRKNKPKEQPSTEPTEAGETPAAPEAPANPEAADNPESDQPKE
jgi:small subunit ribosomal protein S16